MDNKTVSHLEHQTVDGTQLNLDALYQICPSCFTETKGEDGQLKHVINFGKLRALLGDNAVEDAPEVYDFTWVGKRAALREAMAPCRKTLRPCPEESVDWDTTKNLYIEGDNLEVLKLLQNSYMGKVKMIYIDPPYNTGSNLIYRNNFYQSEEDYLDNLGIFDENHNRLFTNTKSNGRFHSDWCSMIYSRLLISRSLLSNDGIIVLTIDDSEIENVTSIMNELYGEDNHLATVVIKNNPSGRSTVKGFSINHEYALFYSKSDLAILGRMKHSDDQVSRYKENDNNGAFEWENFRKNGTDSDRSDRPKQYYPIVINKTNHRLRIPEIDWNDQRKEYDILEEIPLSESIIYPKTIDGIEKVWKYGVERTRSIINEILVKEQKGKYELYRKKYLNDDGSLPRTWWDKPDYSARDNGTRTLTNIFGPVKLFDFPKAPEAVKDSLIAGNVQKGDLVLDFFSGSATTAHAVMQLNAEDGGNRKFIMVQLPEETANDSEAYKAGYKNICEIGKERIRRAGKKIKEEHPEAKDLDVGFRVFKCDESNYKEVALAPKDYDQGQLELLVDNIKKGRSDLDLLFDCMLRWGVTLDLPMSKTEVDGCTIHNVNDGGLVACFDGKVTERVIEAIAEMYPAKVVFRDSSFEEAAQKMNLFEMFKQKCNWTDQEVRNNVKVI